MRNVVLTILFVLGIATLAYWAYTHEDGQKIINFEAQLKKLQGENNELRAKNEALRRRIRNLKVDPRLIEQRARHNSGLVRENETVYQFVGEEKPQTVAVVLKITSKSATLAGQRVTETSLGPALDHLKKRLPAASLKIQLDKNLDPIREQMFRDIIRQKDIRILE